MELDRTGATTWRMSSLAIAAAAVLFVVAPSQKAWAQG
jgi:hypothetical protein